MFSDFIRFLARVGLLSLLLLAGCGSVPTLLSKSPVVPAGINLSGLWQVRPGAARPENTVGAQDRLIPSSRSSRSRRQRGPSGVSAQVFLEYGESLKITQTNYGIFISYDRSVVEEFTFGENRMVTIGPIEARRVSGWEESSFVVETLDDSGTTLFEAWHLENNDTVLVRNIQISKGETSSLMHQQLFDRQ